MNPKTILVRGGKAAIVSALSRYHPVVIEGMGNYDPRDPVVVARNIHTQLQQHWEEEEEKVKVVSKPKLIIVQGDPLQERGISAITPQLATMMGVSRGLVCLDEEIADYHSPNADRENVHVEFRYSDLVQVLEEDEPGVITRLEMTIDRMLDEKNALRQTKNKPPLKDYFRNFALLQEVTKAACQLICEGLTVAHTQQEISEFSVTSFYKAGLELGLVEESQHVSYDFVDDLDFDLIDKR